MKFSKRAREEPQGRLGRAAAASDQESYAGDRGDNKRARLSANAAAPLLGLGGLLVALKDKVVQATAVMFSVRASDRKPPALETSSASTDTTAAVTSGVSPPSAASSRRDVDRRSSLQPLSELTNGTTVAPSGGFWSTARAAIDRCDASPSLRDHPFLEPAQQQQQEMRDSPSSNMGRAHGLRASKAARLRAREATGAHDPRMQYVWVRNRPPQVGLPRLGDVDALRHALGFLSAKDLARFARASWSARDAVATHAALEISDRFSYLRLGMREPSRQQASMRRLAFGAPPPASVMSTAAAGVPSSAVVGTGAADGHSGAIVPHAGEHAHALPHSALWDREVVFARISGSASGSPSGSPTATASAPSIVPHYGPTTVPGRSEGAAGAAAAAAAAAAGPWRRRIRGAGRGAGSMRCDGRNRELALPALRYLECCGDLLLSQLKTLPRLDLFRTLQSRTVLGPSQFLTAHMRAVLVDWMVEVAFQFRLSTISLHAAVSALDVCLSKVAVPRCRLQLLGVVCTMIQSQAGGGCQVMSTTEAIHICDSQYNPSQVHSTFNIVVSNTQGATSRTVPATAAEILNSEVSAICSLNTNTGRLLVDGMGEDSGLGHPLSVDWDRQGDATVKEENVLAGLLIDLSLLDQHMFRFRPGTLASAALFLARVTGSYFCKEEVWVTPFAVVEKNNREVLRLYGDGVCRPFMPFNKDLEKKPFGAPGLGEFVASQHREAAAVRKCVERLWLVQQDFVRHLSGQQSPTTVLFRYQHMFKGIKDKFVPPGSTRLQAYQRLGLVPRQQLEHMLNKHLPSTVPPPASPMAVVYHGNPATPAVVAATGYSGAGGASGEAVAGSESLSVPAASAVGANAAAAGVTNNAPLIL